MSSIIASLLAGYHRSRNVWLAADRDGEDDCDGPEWDALIAAETALFRAPCQSIEDVRAKAKAFLEEDQLFDALVSDWSGPDHRAKQFLRALLSDGPTEPIEPLQTLIAAHEAALAAYNAASDEDWLSDGDVTGRAADATRDALLDHRPATLEEVSIKAEFMARTKTFAEWDNFDQARLIHALTPVTGGAA